jgi:hypothetical protein
MLQFHKHLGLHFLLIYTGWEVQRQQHQVVPAVKIAI